MKSTFRAPSAWVALYWFLTGCFLLATVLNLLRVRGGFLTSHLADLTLPAWLYVLARQKAPGKRRGFPGMLGWLGKTPERAAVVLFLASATTEISQLFWPSGPFAGRFDPLDVAAFAIGLGAVYLADRRSSASGTALPPGS